MGNTQYCCNYKDKDPNAVNYGADENKGITKNKNGATPEV